MIVVVLLFDDYIDVIYFWYEFCGAWVVVKVIVVLLGYDYLVVIVIEIVKICFVVEVLLCDEEFISLFGIGKVDIVEIVFLL